MAKNDYFRKQKFYIDVSTPVEVATCGDPERPTVLLINAPESEFAILGRMAEALKSSYFVIVLTNNFWRDDDVGTMEDIANKMDSALSYFNIALHGVVSWSIGCKLALHLVSKRKERPKCVFLNGVFCLDPLLLAPAMRSIWHVANNISGKSDLATSYIRLLRENAERSGRDESDIFSEVERVAIHLAGRPFFKDAEDLIAYAKSIDLLRGTTLLDVLPGISNQITLICGADDEYSSLEENKEIARLLSNSVVEVLHDISHHSIFWDRDLMWKTQLYLV